jgi:predicted transposase YbfD/YdcC
LRRSHDKTQGLSALHLVIVWSHEAKLTLAQVATEAKPNAITAIPELLELISLKGSVVTISAVLEQGLYSRKVSIIETEETAHGRKENRTYLLLDVPKTFPKWSDWNSLRTLGMVIRTREINGTETGEVRYYIGSIKRDVKTFATAVRGGHWRIENTCHWTLNITPQCEAWLHRITLGLLKLTPTRICQLP